MAKPPKSPEEVVKHEKIQSFRLGWKDWVQGTFNPKRFAHREDLRIFYEQGATECGNAIGKSMEKLCKDIGYESYLTEGVLR